MKTLLAGPWVGEFGWELFCWQGRIRKISRDYDHTIVMSRGGSSGLYIDFCDEFIPITTSNMETDGMLCRGADPINVDIPCDKWVTPEKIRYSMVNGGVPIVRNQEFIQYGEELNSYLTTIVFHARATNKVGSSERNWSIDKWSKLAETLHNKNLDLVSIGSFDGSSHVPLTTDYRGLPLEDLSTVLRNSKIIVGSSSGPMHFASLCGLNQVVWSGHERNYLRYKELWNPFNTDVSYIDTWNPEVSQIEDIICSSI